MALHGAQARAQRRRVRLQVGLLLLAACAPPAGPEPAIELRGSSMGTTYSIVLASLPKGLAADTLHAEIRGILEAANDQMSTYRASSELSRFNASSSTDWFRVSEGTRTVVAEALRIGRLSGGAFDVTVGPVVDLWGFGAAGPSAVAPTRERIDAALREIGYASLHVRPSPPAIRKERPELRVDLSGIAKGFAVDRIARHLEGAGVRNFLVELGGELRAHGSSPRGDPWRVAIEKPSPQGTTIQQVIRLENRALATSGDYRRYRVVNGARYSHIIDPRTGSPISHALASVSVVDASAMRADALATALMVLGPAEGLRVAERDGLAVLFLVKRGERFAEVSTPEFERYRLE